MAIPVLKQILGTITGKLAFERTQENFTTIRTHHNNLETDFNEHKAENVSDTIRPHGLGSIAKEDYEEGVWTPELRFGGMSDGIVYGAKHGFYIRIGKIVYVNFIIRITSKGTSKGSVVISGLPYSTKSGADTYFPLLPVRLALPPGTNEAKGYINNNNISLYASKSGDSDVILTEEHVTNTLSLYCNATYVIRD